MYPLKDSKGNPLYNKDGKPATENRLGVDHFTPHDLRRTATTLMAKSKILKEYRERVTNHKLGKIDGTYNVHDYDDEKREALQELEIHLTCILRGTEYRNRQQREEDRRQAELEKVRAEAGNVVNINEARRQKKAA